MRSRMLALVGLTGGIVHQCLAQLVVENLSAASLDNAGIDCRDICRMAAAVNEVGDIVESCRCDAIKFDLVKRQGPGGFGPPTARPTSETTTTSTTSSETTAAAASTTESASDVTTSAGAVTTSTAPETSSHQPTSTAAGDSSNQSSDSAPFSGSSNSGVSHSATIGIGVGVGVGVALLIGLAAFICLARRRRRSRHEALVGGKFDGHAPSESSMVEQREIPTSGLPPGAYLKQPLSQETGYYGAGEQYSSHSQPGSPVERYADHVDEYGAGAGAAAPAAMAAGGLVAAHNTSPTGAGIVAPAPSTTPPNADRRPPSMAAIREDNPQTYQPTLPQPLATRQPTGLPLPALHIPSPRDDERTPLASRQGTPMRSGSVSPVSPVSPITPEGERPASLRGHT